MTPEERAKAIVEDESLIAYEIMGWGGANEVKDMDRLEQAIAKTIREAVGEALGEEQQSRTQ